MRKLGKLESKHEVLLQNQTQDDQILKLQSAIESLGRAFDQQVKKEKEKKKFKG